MKNSLFVSVLMTVCVHAFGQAGNSFFGDADKVFGLAKEAAYKQGYRYLIKFNATNNAAINVSPNTGYVIFFVYDNTNMPVTDFNAHLMTPDRSLMEKYTLRPFDRAQVGVARVQQLEFSTGSFAGKTKPVKLEAKPPAFIYVFFKKLSAN